MDVAFVTKHLVNIKKMKFICYDCYIYLIYNKMDIDRFTFQNIISYCDADTKLVMRVICKQYNTIKIIKKKESSRYKKYAIARMKKQTDKEFRKMPMFFDFIDEELTTIKIKLPKKIKFNYELPEDEFCYKNDKFWETMRVVNFQKLVKFLRKTNIDEKYIQDLIKASNVYVPIIEHPENIPYIQISHQ